MKPWFQRDRGKKWEERPMVQAVIDEKVSKLLILSCKEIFINYVLKQYCHREIFMFDPQTCRAVFGLI